MAILKKIGLGSAAVSFVITLAAISGEAQGRRHWAGDDCRSHGVARSSAYYDRSYDRHYDRDRYRGSRRVVPTRYQNYYPRNYVYYPRHRTYNRYYSNYYPGYRSYYRAYPPYRRYPRSGISVRLGW